MKSIHNVMKHTHSLSTSNANMWMQFFHQRCMVFFEKKNDRALLVKFGDPRSAKSKRCWFWCHQRLRLRTCCILLVENGASWIRLLSKKKTDSLLWFAKTDSGTVLFNIEPYFTKIICLETVLIQRVVYFVQRGQSGLVVHAIPFRFFFTAPWINIVADILCFLSCGFERCVNDFFCVRLDWIWINEQHQN